MGHQERIFNTLQTAATPDLKRSWIHSVQ